MFDIIKNVQHGIAQYQAEAVSAEQAGNDDRAKLCRDVVSVLKETLADIEALNDAA